MKPTGKQHLPSRGFTLVEVLMVMVILSLMGGMVVAAVRGVTEAGRESRTRAIIATCDAVIQEQYESFKYRPLPVEIPDVFRPNVRTGNEVGFDVLATEAARVRLMMIRDLQRMEMPDRLSDILNPTTPLTPRGASTIRAAVNPVIELGGAVVAVRDDPTQRRMMPVNWYNSSSLPSRQAAYLSRIPLYLPSPPAAPSTLFNPIGQQEMANQGAECLYMILSTSFIGGTPAIDAIPRANIGDTDNDGLLEILDGWGRPLVFIRWPVGYYDPDGLTDTSQPDDFDLFRADYAYVAPTLTSRSKVTDKNHFGAPNTLPGHLTPRSNPWSMRPLVMSVGPDGQSGIATNPWETDSFERAEFAYSSSAWYWPVTSPTTVADEYYGAEAPGRDRGIGTTTYGNHPYLDPYLRVFANSNATALLPGQEINATFRADNISNYSLQAAQ